MICPNCQKEIPDTARACGYCGHWLGGEKPTQPKPDLSPTTRRNPPWFWIGLGVVAVIVVAGLAIFMTGRNNPANPTATTAPETIDVEATIAAAIAATRQGETVTAQADQAVKATSVATSQPVDTPNTVIDTDSALYDNFDNPAFDGSFDPERWVAWENKTYQQIVQQKGVLAVTLGKRPSDGWAPLGTLKYSEFAIDKPTFFEIKFMMEASKPPESHTFLGLFSNLPSGEYTDCTFGGDGSSEKAQVNCNYAIKPGENYYNTDGKSVDYGTWHSVRIEVDPDRMLFTYYIDGDRIASYGPNTKEQLKQAKFNVAVGVSGESHETFVGYIDDVRIGPIYQQTWEFALDGNSEGWVAENQLDPLKVKDGTLKTRSTGNDPYLVSPKFAVDAASSPSIEVRMKISETTAGSTGQLFFLTGSDEATDAGFSEDKKIQFLVKGDGQFHIYSLDMSTVEKWNGAIKQIRLDPTEDIPAAIEIDYIRLKAQ